MSKRICFLGNCQTVGLCSYVSRTPSKPQCKWLCMDMRWSRWSNSEKTFGAEQLKNHEYIVSKYPDILINCDVIVYQPHHEISKFFTINKIRSFQHIKRIPISPIFVDRIPYMKKKEQKYNCDIKISSIIKNNRDKKLHVKHKNNHPSTFLLLEITKQICNISEISYFSEQEYNDLLKIQYPNY